MSAGNRPPLDRRFASPNYNERGGAAIDYLIIHHTATREYAHALARYLDNQPGGNGGRISPHYLIAEDGVVFYLVDEDKRAWHAGHSCWDGQNDLNSYSIGIELAHPGWDADHGFTGAQLDALKALGGDIVRRHNIPARHVLGHSDISADRKVDPGYWFPWKDMAEAGLGVWPEPGPDDEKQAAHTGPDQWCDWLHSYGYCKAYEKGDLMYAFYQHFYPEAFETTAKPDPYAPERAALARLHRLVRMKQQELRPSA